jgi:hypothetical protein
MHLWSDTLIWKIDRVPITKLIGTHLKISNLTRRMKNIIHQHGIKD